MPSGNSVDPAKFRERNNSINSTYRREVVVATAEEGSEGWE